MALVDGKLYNCDDDLPTDMWWYPSTYSTNPPASGDKVGLCTAGTDKAWAISLSAAIYKVWLPGVGGGKWATRTPDNTMVVVEPYTHGSWRAPGNAPEPQGIDKVKPPKDPENYEVDLVIRFKKVNGQESEPLMFTKEPATYRVDED